VDILFWLGLLAAIAILAVRAARDPAPPDANDDDWHWAIK
jgi:hypothetical protein